MKKRIFVVILVIVFLLSFGCASKELAPQDNRNSGDGFAGEGDESTVISESQTTRKIIKNGSVDLETDDVVKAYADILAFAKQNGGYEFKHTRAARSNYITITAQIKIKPEKLDALMDFAGNAAVIINSSTTSDDITDDYYDAQIRLESKKKSLEKYYEFLAQARNVDETLKLQNEINNLTEEIEALEGKLKMWDEQVSESTLSLTLSQVSDPSKPKKKVNWSAMSFSDMGTLIKNGFISVSNVLIAIFQWVLIIVIAASPLIVIAVIVYLIDRRRRKAKEAKKREDSNKK